MERREYYKTKIENQLAQWKTTIEGLKSRLERAEVDAKAKIHDQLEGLHDKRLRAEKMLEELSSTSQDAWEQIKSGAEQGWSDLTRTAKSTMGKVPGAIAKPKRNEEIRQISYHLWRSVNFLLTNLHSVNILHINLIGLSDRALLAAEVTKRMINPFLQPQLVSDTPLAVM